MKLATLEDKANYSLNNGLTVESVNVIDAQNVRILTSLQPQTTTFALTVTNLEDLAGNKVDSGTPVEFKSFGLANGVVGLEVWRNLGGGSVQNLLDFGNYPDSPDRDFVTTAIDSFILFPQDDNNDDNTFGARFRAWLVPNETAEYEFFIAGDNSAEFFISANDQFGELDNPNRPADLQSSGAFSISSPSRFRSKQARSTPSRFSGRKPTVLKWPAWPGERPVTMSFLKTSSLSRPNSSATSAPMPRMRTTTACPMSTKRLTA